MATYRNFSSFHVLQLFLFFIIPCSLVSVLQAQDTQEEVQDLEYNFEDRNCTETYMGCVEWETIQFSTVALVGIIIIVVFIAIGIPTLCCFGCAMALSSMHSVGPSEHQLTDPEAGTVYTIERDDPPPGYWESAIPPPSYSKAVES